MEDYDYSDDSEPEICDLLPPSKRSKSLLDTDQSLDDIGDYSEPEDITRFSTRRFITPNPTPLSRKSNVSAGKATTTSRSTPSRRKQPSHSQSTPTGTLDNLENSGAGGFCNLPNSDSHEPEHEMPLPPGVSRVLRDLTSTMNTVLKRMDTIKNTVKHHISTLFSSSESGSGSKKKTRSSIPLLVRVSFFFDSIIYSVSYFSLTLFYSLK